MLFHRPEWQYISFESLNLYYDLFGLFYRVALSKHFPYVHVETGHKISKDPSVGLMMCFFSSVFENQTSTWPIRPIQRILRAYLSTYIRTYNNKLLIRSYY